ncbi:hypothetical protein [Streptomyces sp. NPDC001621]|uniref:hypothetical protein n=1 Tax=Streptomyces sp. NPDC001621 TaxID=3364594 RepID=UPI0036BF884D
MLADNPVDATPIPGSLTRYWPQTDATGTHSARHGDACLRRRGPAQLRDRSSWRTTGGATAVPGPDRCTTREAVPYLDGLTGAVPEEAAEPVWMTVGRHIARDGS